MPNEQKQIYTEESLADHEKKTSKEFLNEMLDMAIDVAVCRNRDYSDTRTIETNTKRITKCLSFIKEHSSEIEQAISENEKDVFSLIFALSRYSLEEVAEEKEDTYLDEENLREKTAVATLSLLNGMRETVQKYISDSFSKIMNEETSKFDTRKAFDLANYYLQLSLGKYVSSEEHSILNAIRVIEPIAPILEKLKETRIEESPSPVIETIKRGNYLLLHTGDPKIIREYIDDFVNDEETEDFGFLSFENLFPADGRTSYWNEEISSKLLSLLAKKEADSSDYNEFEIQRARQLILNIPREKIIMNILRQYQLPYQPLSSAWIQSSRPEYMGYWHGGNLQAIRDLEKESPGSAKKLFDTNGIRCFTRYRKEFLLDQLNPPSKNESNGLMVSRYNDWNGAFSGSNMATAHDKIREESEKLGIKVRVAEYADTTDLFYRLQTMCAKNENDPELKKVEYVWINQHGDKITSETEKEQIQKDWEYVFGIGENRESLITDTVACLMCSGGEKDNVMDVIAKQYDITTIGPSETTQGIKSVSFKRDEETGKLSIDIDYDYSTKETDFAEGKTIRYNYGER